MTFTDLSSVARQGTLPPRPQPGQQPQEPDPAQQPPDPRSFERLPPTNPVAALESQVPPPQIPTGFRGDDKADEEKDTAAKDAQQDARQDAQDDGEDVLFPPPVFPPATYRPPTDSRNPSEWGTESGPLKLANSYASVASNPDMPSVPESYSEVAGSGEYLHQFAAPDVAEPAWRAALMASPLVWLLNGISQGRFSNNFNTADLNRLHAQQAELILNTNRAWAFHSDFMLGAGRIVAGIDPAHPLEAAQQMEDYLNTHQHHYLIGTLHRQGLPGVVQALNDEDRQIRRMMNASSQIGKAAKGANTDMQELESLGVKTGVSTESTGPLQFNVPGRGSPEAPSTPAKDQTIAENQSLSDLDKTIAGSLHFRTPDGVDHKIPIDQAQTILREARRRAMGDPEEISTKSGSIGDNLIGQATMAYNRAAEQIMRYKEPASTNRTEDEVSQDKLASLDKAGFGDKAGLLKANSEYQIPPGDTSTKDNARQILDRQTKAVFPRYNPGFYHTYHTVYENGGSRPALALQAAERLGSEAITFTRVVNGLPIGEEAGKLQTFITELREKGVSNNPKYGELNDIVQLVARDAVAIHGRGQTQVSFVQQIAAGMPLTASKGDFRAVFRDIVIGANNIINDEVAEFKKSSGLDRNPPYFSEQGNARIKAIVRGNPYMSTFDDKAPDELKNVAAEVISDPKYRQKRPGWMTDSMMWKPMTEEEYDGRMNWLKQNPKDPRAAAVRRELGLSGQ